MVQIELVDISKSFGEKQIFSNYNLTIEKGEFLGLKGKSGKGKTTLLNIIGLLDSFEGQILLDGETINQKDRKLVRHLLKHRMGYLFQNFALIDDASVYDNLKIVMGRDKKENIRKKMLDALSKVGLDDVLNQKIYTLSGGEQQRIAIARLMLKQCDIILADEPTGSLDSSNGKMVIDLLKQMNQENKTIIMVSHDDKSFVNCSRVVEI